jgi:apolipoprotein N-acyltransferase
VQLTGSGGEASGAAEPGLGAGPGTAGPAAAGPSGPGGGLPGRLAFPVAAAGGLALAAAFPPVGAWPLAAAGPALLTVSLWRRSWRGAALAGLVFGLAFFVPLLAWLINLAWYAWMALAVAEALIFAVLTVGQWLLLRLRAWPVAVAGWWVLAEAIRDRWPWGGFPWGRLAMSQAGTPTVRWVSVAGPPLLTFLLALTGAALAWLLLGRPGPDGNESAGDGRVRRRVVPALALAGAAGVALAGAALPLSPASGGQHATVAAVQGNVPHSRSLQGVLRATTVTGNHAAATEQLARQVRAGTRAAPDLVVWPENSTDIDPNQDPVVYATIAAAVQAIDRPVLVGAVLQDPVRNAGLLWLPGQGPVATYLKRQLVPFGEVIPFRGFLSTFVPLVKLQPRDFTPGHRAVVFRLGKLRAGDVICYEVGFDNLVSSQVKAGANLLVVQTNDATFEVDGQTGETLQQLAMARIRAIENDRAVVVASTTGVSAIIAPDGSLITHSGTWRRAVLEARVPLRAGTTLAGHLGSWPELAISALTLIAVAWAAGQAVRARRQQVRAARG